MAVLSTIQVHETYSGGGNMPHTTWPDHENYLQPYSATCDQVHQHNSKCVGFQLMFSDGTWHQNSTYRLHVVPFSSSVPNTIADAILRAFNIRIAPEDDNQMRLIRICNSSCNLIQMRFVDIPEAEEEILVVHLLPKMVEFSIEYVHDPRRQGDRIRVQISAHDSLLQIKHAIHKALGLRANQTVDFRDRYLNSIEPTWSDFPHSPLGVQGQTMRLAVLGGQSLPAIIIPAATDYEAIVQHYWKDVNSDHCVDRYIRPGINDEDEDVPDRNTRSREPGIVSYKSFEEFTGNLMAWLSRLAILTPHNRQLARRLLWCIVMNRYQGTSSSSYTAEVLPADVKKAVDHLESLPSNYPSGVNAHNTQNGQYLNTVLRPWSAPSLGRRLNHNELDDLLAYQHVVARDFNEAAKQQQLNYSYL